jgi:hypothetical protein
MHGSAASLANSQAVAYRASRLPGRLFFDADYAETHFLAFPLRIFEPGLLRLFPGFKRFR